MPATGSEGTPDATSDGRLYDGAVSDDTFNGVDAYGGSPIFPDGAISDASFSDETSPVPLYGAAADCDEPRAVPDGGVAVPGSCSDKDYVTLTSDYSCDGGSANPCDLTLLANGCFVAGDDPCHGKAYALCVDGSYSACSTAPPLDGSMQPLPGDGGLGGGGPGADAGVG
jgi:hypothetical protein